MTPDLIADFHPLTDLYLLTMMQSYWRYGMNRMAVFDLHVRDLPENWNFLVACGQDELLDLLSDWKFSADFLGFLRSLKLFSPDFLDDLRTFRFSGEVDAVPEGTVIFPYEPILQVRAPLMEAQCVETLVINRIHFQTLAASKATRVVLAAEGRTVIDFGLRRIHGPDAGLQAARSFYIAGVDQTSNVMAGEQYGIPVAGTMAHSYVESCESEAQAFENFVQTYPDAILLVDTYDTLEGVQRVIDLSRRWGKRFRVRGIRLDSGDLGNLAKRARRLLDGAGLHRLLIFASGGLDEYEIARLMKQGAPIDGFGVGTKMGVSADQPYLDMAYKLVEYDGLPRTKLSARKETLPGLKQVFRRVKGKKFHGDEIALGGERPEGAPLLQCTMKKGRRVMKKRPLPVLRESLRENLKKFPEALKKIHKAARAYPVTLSPGLKKLRRDLRQKFTKVSFD